MQKTWVQSWGWEDPLEEEMVAPFNIVLGYPMNREAWPAAVHGAAKNQTRLSN